MTVATECLHSSSRPGMYSKLTSKTTGLLGGTLGLPGAEVRPLGNVQILRTTSSSDCYLVFLHFQLYIIGVVD
jgi:hypothetical protein